MASEWFDGGFGAPLDGALPFLLSAALPLESDACLLYCPCEEFGAGGVDVDGIKRNVVAREREREG